MPTCMQEAALLSPSSWLFYTPSMQLRLADLLEKIQKKHKLRGAITDLPSPWPWSAPRLTAGLLVSTAKHGLADGPIHQTENLP